jgi:hypothetical protein
MTILIAGVVIPRQCWRPQDQAFDSHHRHFVDSPAEEFHQCRQFARAHAHVAGDHPRRLPFSALAMALVDKTMTQTLALQHQKTTSPELRMTAIKQEDLIQSVADAFQYISYYHPLDYIKALGEAYEREESPPPRMPSPRS